MNNIRKNNEEEKEIISAQFKIPWFCWLLLVFPFLISLLFIICGIAMNNIDNSPSASYYSYNEPSNDGSSFIGIGIFFIIVVVVELVCFILIAKRSRCVVTNKRIYGINDFVIVKKRYSYRLDQINNVETATSFGVNSLVLNFTQGSQHVIVAGQSFKINNIKNFDEMYNELCNLITSVKNDKDTLLDVEINKVETEARKAKAFEDLAANFTGKNSSMNSNYIKELKELKGLLDEGIISKEEFESKKKELLKNK